MTSVTRVRNIGKYFILFDNILIVFGFFVVFPLISIHFVDHLGWAGLLVGFALGLRQLMQQVLAIFGGALADRFGAKPMIVSGMLLRTVSFAVMAVADQPWILILACVFSAFGGALFDPPRSAIIIKLTRPHERGRFFSILMIQDSAGTVLGALAGSWLLQYDFSLVCWTGSALFFIAALCNYFILPSYRIALNNNSMRKGILQVLRDRRFVNYVLTLTGYYILSVQVLLMLPIVVYQVAGDANALKWMYSIETILSLTLLYPIVVWSEKHFRLEQRVMLGLLIMTLGLSFIGFATHLTTLLMLIAVFYLGSVIVEPARETLNASLVDSRARGSYMGFSRIGLALGGMIGYSGGGSLYDLGKTYSQPQLPWLLLGVIGMMTLIAIYWQFSRKPVLVNN